jgi:acetyl esterase/lipase
MILYLHPGGYAVGSVNGHRHVAAAYSRAAAARVLAIDYRLAPEHPHPAAVEDAVTAFSHLVDSGTPASEIAIVGESAGGGLALAALVALRDAGGPQAACGIAVSPWTDLTLSGDSMDANAAEDVVNSRAMLGGLAMMYLSGIDPRTPLASPLYADLTALPPVLVMAGSTEVLLDDATRFVGRAGEAGVDATLNIAQGMPHIWTFFESFLAQGRDAIEQAGQFVARHCSGARAGAAAT